MNESLNELRTVIAAYVPNIVAALLILIVGWILAVIIAAVLRAALRRTRLDERIARSIAGTDSQATIRSEAWISAAIFWLIMLFVIVAALQALNLTIITTPLNDLLSNLLGFLPQLLAAALLVVVAWLLATVLRLVVSRGLRALRFDERIDAERNTQERTAAYRPAGDVGAAGTPIVDAGARTTRPATAAVAGARQPASLADTIGNAVYWLVFLLFLPAILDTLNLEGLLTPVQNLVNEILAFLPNLFAAALILVVGWFVARIVRRIVTNALAAVGTDRLSERIGLSTVLGQQSLSNLLGLIVYILILMPVIISALNALQIEAITAPASTMLTSFLDAIPNIFAAGLILLIAYVVGRLIANLVANLLKGMGFNGLMASLGIGRQPVATPTSPAAATTSTPSDVALTTTTPADIVGTVVLVGVMLFAAIAAFNLLGFVLVAALVSEFTVLVGRIILGLIIFAIGLFLGNMAARAIVTSRMSQAGLLALAARVSIIILAGAMALRQMGLANEIINLAFGLLLGAVAVAFALMFGLGGRKPAEQEVERLFQALRDRQNSITAAAPPAPAARPGPQTSPGSSE
jgi:hypothetical protein